MVSLSEIYGLLAGSCSATEACIFKVKGINSGHWNVHYELNLTAMLI